MKRVAFVGNYLPRQCGIATFTTDLCQAVTAGDNTVNCFVVAINDKQDGYDYPPEVRFEIAEQEMASYRRAADFLNVSGVDLVCLQHEYGIFGGPAGSHILGLLRELRMPIVTTLHTILREPDPYQRKVMNELARLSQRLVVMSRHGSEFLQEIYQVPAEKIDLIPHGIPDVPFVDPNFYKDQFGVEGKQVLLTFGLLSPNKGIEHVIRALPAILERHPNVVYIVLGATHPNILQQEGESYRLSLQRLARQLGVSAHVIFHNRFVSLQELVEFIGAADIYLTPYLNRAQIVSGTLAYTVGAGKAVISTPYWYAEELLADGRGLLVPFADAEALAEKVCFLLDNEAERHAMRKRAYLLGREMIWPTVARRYLESFECALAERITAPHVFMARQDSRPAELPLLKLDHLRRMTDGTGLLQHAVFTVPNYSEGYTTDDNARSLVLTVLLEEADGEMSPEVHLLASRYLAFLWHAFNMETGRFRNFFSYDRRWQEDVGSEDSHARSIWGLGTVVGRSNIEGLRNLASRMFELALPATVDFSSPRAWAFTLVGIHEYLRRFSGDRVVNQVRATLGERLMELYNHHSAEDWPWFEDVVTYSNAKLPHALLLCGQWMERGDMLEAGLKSLRWLVAIQQAEEGHFAFVGNNGFYSRNGEKARFDQQPVEAHAMVSACLEAFRATGDLQWYHNARNAFEWFLGRNDLGLPLYDSFTGGCRDGLLPNMLNQNQGAEATLSFLLSLVEMRLAEHLINVRETPETVVPAAGGTD